MEDLLLKYSAIPHKYILKGKEFGDNRLLYHDYIEEQKKHAYTLIICRDAYAKKGWVTSRYVEAVSCWSMPIVDKCYDIYNHYKYATPRCDGENDARELIMYYSNNPIERTLDLIRLNSYFESSSHNFKELISVLGRTK